MPELQTRLPIDLTTFGLVLFALTGLCFFLTGCANPGVPKRPAQPDPNALSGALPHPGEGYEQSRDSNRYVLGRDHYCEFVGNDIGKGNMGFFVSFLVLLSTLSTYVVVLSGYQVYLNLVPPTPEWRVLPDLWRMVLAAVLVALFAWGLRSCAKSPMCEGVLPLIMMMPGATVGAVLITIVLGATVLLPLTTDMLSGETSNPTAFFLILPCLCFAVLFWGMSAHWVHLQCVGLRQVLWLRAKGSRRPRKPTEAGTSLTALV